MQNQEQNNIENATSRSDATQNGLPTEFVPIKRTKKPRVKKPVNNAAAGTQSTDNPPSPVESVSETAVQETILPETQVDALSPENSESAPFDNAEPDANYDNGTAQSDSTEGVENSNTDNGGSAADVQSSEEENAATNENREQQSERTISFEHFSDYEPITLEPEPEQQSELDGEPVEYENLTILDEAAPTESENPQKSPPPQPDPDKAPYDHNKPRKVDVRFDFLELFVFTLLAVMILTTFVFRHSIVEGASMQTTLSEGDHLIISDLFYKPRKNDIIVCEDFETGLKTPIVKRVIATEGDTIEILPSGTVIVNDEILEEDYVYVDGPSYFSGLSKCTVPEGKIFVMGDHRNDSTDSRSFGFVKEDAVLGRVLFRFMPFEKLGKVD